jgi:L-fuconolactonase
MSEPAVSRRAFAALAASTVMTAAPRYRIVDPHVHVWKKDPRYPFASGQPEPDAERTPEDLLALMQANGVAKTVIIQVRYYMFDNRYLAAVLKQYPNHFKGVARVDPRDPAAPDHLSRLVAEDGMEGVRLSPNGMPPGDWFTNAALMEPLWRRCRDLKIPMTLLMPITQVPNAAKLIDRFPDLTVVIDHMADCPVDQPEELNKLLALARYPKVFVKISHTWSISRQPYPWLDAQEHVKRLHQAFGPQRLMWATDWPVSLAHASYAQTLSVVRDDMKFLNEDDKSWILSKTIDRVWKFA